MSNNLIGFVIIFGYSFGLALFASIIGQIIFNYVHTRKNAIKLILYMAIMLSLPIIVGGLNIDFNLYLVINFTLVVMSFWLITKYISILKVNENKTN
jgi:hypothetical protein